MDGAWIIEGKQLSSNREGRNQILENQWVLVTLSEEENDDEEWL